MVLVSRGVTVPVPARMWSPNYPNSEIIPELAENLALCWNYHLPQTLLYGGNVLYASFRETDSIDKSLQCDIQDDRILPFGILWFLVQNRLYLEWQNSVILKIR